MTKARPAQRCLEWCRERGWLAESVEKWIQATRTRRDLFGIADILAITDEGPLLIQACGEDFQEHVRKVYAEPRAGTVLRWIPLEIWGWRRLKWKTKDGAWAKTPRWNLRCERITLEQWLCAQSGTQPSAEQQPNA